ncbi:MAG: fibronectin type III domain-containing protein, partial [Flavobacteriaceae bacterium]
SNLLDFPVLITLDHLNNEIVDGGANSALNGGGDIRFSSDAGGNNQLAVEVVEFVTSPTPANRRCQIWVKVPSLSAISDTTIYIWYNKTGEVQPAAGSVYGSQSVWSNYDFVTHDMRTESSSGKTITLNNAASLSSGPFGTSVSDFNGSTNYHSWDPSGMGLSSQRTISVWANFDPSTSTVWQRMFQLAVPNNLLAVQLASTDGRFIFGTDNGTGTHVLQSGTRMLEGFNSNIWYRVTGSWTTLETGTDLKVNSGSSATLTALDNMGGGSSAQTARFGNRSDGNNYFDGRMACFTISKDLLSDDYVETEYNNQSSPSTFAVAGTPQSASSGGGDTQSPTAPALSSTGQTQTTADLSWSGATDNIGVAGYKVFKDGTLETTLGNITTYQVTGLTASTTYSFTVTALDAAGNESAPSNSVSVTTDSTSGRGGGTSIWSESGTTASYSGEVAVGLATVPTGYKMAIDGKLVTEEVRVELSDSWPDYVFQEGYDLPTLEEIQRHIKEKGHLPNIPSAQEVEVNGIEVGKMNRLLLEKIEELMLHTIQLNEQNKQQREINKQLRKELQTLKKIVDENF